MFLVDVVVDLLTAIADAMPELMIVDRDLRSLRAAPIGSCGNFFDGVQSGRVARRLARRRLRAADAASCDIAVWVFALVDGVSVHPGLGDRGVQGLSVLLGLMVSIGASGIVGQAASGLILMYTRTFRPGEYVRIGDHEGTVVEMGMFTSRVRTGLGEELTLPNSLVLGVGDAKLFARGQGAGFRPRHGRHDRLRRAVAAGARDADRGRAAGRPGVLADPPPRVFQTALSDFYAEYRLVCQAMPTEPRPRAEVLSSLHANVQDVFNEYGVQIMSPHYLGDPAQAKVVPEGALARGARERSPKLALAPLARSARAGRAALRAPASCRA